MTPDDSNNDPGSQDTPQEPPANVVTPPVKPSSKQEPPADQGKDWETAYKGLQRNYTKLESKLAEIQAKYDGLSEQHEALVQSSNKSTSSLSDLQKQLEDRDRTIQQLQSQGQGHEIYKERMMLLLGEYADLAPFEAKGLLPDAPTLDITKEKLNAFRESLKQVVGEGVLDRIRGTVPPPSGTQPPGNGNLDADQLYDELTTLAGSTDPKDRARYDELNAKWLQAFEEKQ